MKIIHVVGARPNFMKIAPIIEAINQYNLSSRRPVRQILVHTGQHYDDRMSKLFFDELDIPKPDINLEVGSGSHAEQTAEIMKRFEKVCLSERPTHILVVGDVNSTIACALVATKLNIKVIHVEAGLRSFNRSMPEEINRILTDAISDYLFITEKNAEENLHKEGISRDKIFFVGNVMIDTLLKHREKAEKSKILDHLGLRKKLSMGTSRQVADYGLLTLHRPSNVDDPKTFRGMMEAIIEISKHLPIIFPVHPRTRKQIEELRSNKGFMPASKGKLKKSGIYCIDPLGYLDFLCLMSFARLVLTDSGGIQEETTVLGVPCVTLRDETERPITLTDGTNVLAGTKKENIIEKAFGVLTHKSKDRKRGQARPSQIPPLWDGKAAMRIVDILCQHSERRLVRGN